MKEIQVARPSMPALQEYIDEISDLWETHWLTNMGVKHQSLEKKLKEYLKVDNITLFTNGHLALESILSVMDLSGEVITTPYTFASTTHAIVRCGLKPVFCDIDPRTLTMDVTKIESLISEKTTAILPVHVYGNICNVTEIERIAKKHNLKVIYDAAHAFGSKINNISISSFGDASMFSFHATKVFNTIEGGAITFSDTSLIKKLNDIKNFGISSPETVDVVGGNAKMNEFQAAMGICNLRHLDKEIQKRKIIFDRYVLNLKNVDGIQLFIPDQNIDSNYSYFPVLFNNYYKNRNEIFEALKKENIIARKYFFPITSEFGSYNDKFNSNLTPHALHVSQNILTLPLYADLELEIVDFICDLIKAQR